MENRWLRIELAIVEDPSCVLIGRTRIALDNSLLGRHLKVRHSIYFIQKYFNFLLVKFYVPL